MDILISVILHTLLYSAIAFICLFTMMLSIAYIKDKQLVYNFFRALHTFGKEAAKHVWWSSIGFIFRLLMGTKRYEKACEEIYENPKDNL